jgi:hypothetical protein
MIVFLKLDIFPRGIQIYNLFLQFIFNKISELILMCADPFLSPEMPALRMEKCLHVTPKMHAIYHPHGFQKTNLKCSRHHLQLMGYKFVQIFL